MPACTQAVLDAGSLTGPLLTASGLFAALLHHTNTLVSALRAARSVLESGRFSELRSIAVLHRPWLCCTQGGHSTGNTGAGAAVPATGPGLTLGHSCELRLCLDLLADAGDSPSESIDAKLQSIQAGINGLEPLVGAAASCQGQAQGSDATLAAALGALRREREVQRRRQANLQQQLSEVRQLLQRETKDAVAAAKAAHLLLQLVKPAGR